MQSPHPSGCCELNLNKGEGVFSPQQAMGFPHLIFMKRTLPFIIIFTLFSLLLILPVLVTGQTGVTAEAIGQVNLRSQPTTAAENIIGEILNGTQYPVIGRSETLPWLLLGDANTSNPIGWAFQDLLIVTGDINQVPFSTLDVSLQPTATDTLSTDPTSDGITSTPFYSVTGSTSNEINIRYTPDVNGERVGVAQAGDTFPVIAYHTQFDWVQIIYEGSPNGLAWVYSPLLDYDGDIYTLPAISQTTFNLPTLTPTSAPIFSSGIPSQELVGLSPAFQQLANSIWELVVERGGFDPLTSRIGAVYVQDMQTGEAFTFGNDIAFSGTSINKIPILT